MAYTTKVVVFLLQLISLLIAFSLHAQPYNVIKSLPGYSGDLPFHLETGYVGVGEEEKVQLFYYFVESERDVESDPLMLWLTGGPGCSAFSGLVLEIGPMMFDYTAKNSEGETPKLQRNPYSWTKVASIIFVDSPVGTGFSYATTSEASYSNDTLQAAHLYDFLRKWLAEHPQFARSPIYIAGDSYSGIVVPIVVQEILEGIQAGLEPRMNLKGYILGNASTKIDVDINAKFEYANRVSLLSDEIYESARANCNDDFENVDAMSSKCLRSYQTMNKNLYKLNEPHILEHSCPFRSPRPTKEASRRSRKVQGRGCRTENYELLYTWANDARVRKAIHIREGIIGHWVRCNKSLAYKENDGHGVTAFDYHKNFTKQSLRALIYSGDQDLAVPYLGMLQWINELDISISDDWRPWYVKGQVGGYVTQFSHYPYSLTYTTIKGGGHTAPEYKPREALAMLDRWVSSTPL